MNGLNIRFSVLRSTSGTDDAYGGSSVTYPTVYSSVRGNLQGKLPEEEMVSIDPGMLTRRELTMTCQPGDLDIRENDVIKITAPSHSPYLDNYLRVLKVSYSNFTPRDRRKYIMLHLGIVKESITELN